MSIEIDVYNMRFIDPLNFIPMALADMLKAFGETERPKGIFLICLTELKTNLLYCHNCQI